MADGRDGPCKNSLGGMRKKLLDDIVPKGTISLSDVTESKIKRETASAIHTFIIRISRYKSRSINGGIDRTSDMRFSSV